MSRLPDRGPRPDHGQHRRLRLKNWQIAVIAILIVTVGPYLAFTKHIPFTSHGYTLNAVFRNSANIAINSPVRVAGVNVGKVISVGRDGNDSKVTFTVSDAGRPIAADAFAEIRPRIFLEGNFFVDLDPGSPSAPKLAGGSTIPITHTSTAVQFDEILTSLQSPVRADLGRLLQGYGTALTHQPTPAEDVTQDPLVKGVSGAGGLNLALLYGGKAGRSSAQVTNAFLGTEPHDLSRLVAGAGKTFSALSANQRKLESLVVNWNTFTGALAAQSNNLAATVRELGPTLRTAHSSFANLDAALPPLRTWAREFTPAVAELPALDQGRRALAGPGQPAARRRRGRRHREDARPNFGGLRPGGEVRAQRDQPGQPAQSLHQPHPGPDRQPGDHRPVQHRPARTTRTSSTTPPTWRARARTSTATDPSLAC